MLQVFVNKAFISLMSFFTNLKRRKAAVPLQAGAMRFVPYVEVWLRRSETKTVEDVAPFYQLSVVSPEGQPALASAQLVSSSLWG